MNTVNTEPYTLYKMDISYFSGKIEAYLRYKEIPYESIECCDDIKAFHRVGYKTGFQKVPAIEMSDGKWLFDTTPMIQWLERNHSGQPVLPDDPALRFVALLIEDYGDEWLWRPAMWWRWVPKVSRVAMGRRIAKIFSMHIAIPVGFFFAKRQLNEWLWNDGVNKHNSNDVRDMLFRELEFLEPLLEETPYILGSHPSIADYGYFGSFFRHFGNDIVSAEVMRRHGPNTYEWLARLWNAKHSKLSSEVNWTWPNEAYWQPLLTRIAKDYLPYLKQNALAFKQGKKRFDYQGESLAFRQTVTTHYRVWCRQELKREFVLLTESDQTRVLSLFESVGGIDDLQHGEIVDSGMGAHLRLPIDPEHTKKPLNLLSKYLGQPRN